MLSELLCGAGMGDLAYTMEMCGCGIDEHGEPDQLRPIFNRIGSKFALRNEIVPMIPSHTKYVEPFAGSAAIFFSKEKAPQNVLNDLDKNTARGLRMLVNAPTDPDSYPNPKTLAEHKHYFTHPLKSKQGQIALRIVETADGFNGTTVERPEMIYRTVNIPRKVRHIAQYKEKLKGVKITSEDYEKVIRKNDGANTFFFIDPPYENSVKKLGYAEDSKFDFERLAKVLHGIRGKFLMTMNDSPRIRELFKGFHIKPFVAISNLKSIQYRVGKKMMSHKYERKEVYVSNYKLPGR